MYSDMSTRIKAFSSPKRYSASARASSVFPTPVGPRKMNEPTCRFASFRPARERRIARDTAATASSWPMIRPRSEERRVGKECRSRWPPDHYKKKLKLKRHVQRAETQNSADSMQKRIVSLIE